MSSARGFGGSSMESGFGPSGAAPRLDAGKSLRRGGGGVIRYLFGAGLRDHPGLSFTARRSTRFAAATSRSPPA